MTQTTKPKSTSTPKRATSAPKQGKATAQSAPERGVWRTLLRNVVLAVSLLVIILVVAHLLLGVTTRHGRNKDVPNFIGATIEEAESMAREGRLEIIVNDSLYVPLYAGGVILEQRPSAGKDKVKSGRKIYVTINASRQRTVEVPYVAGYSLRQAKSNLLVAGLEIARLEYVEDIANNYVIAQRLYGKEIKADSAVMAPVGSKITLVVGGNSSHTEVVPDLTGMTLREVKSTLWDLGLNLGAVEYEGTLDIAQQNAARVYLQSPVAESVVGQGKDVSVRLRLPEEEDK